MLLTLSNLTKVHHLQHHHPLPRSQHLYEECDQRLQRHPFMLHLLHKVMLRTSRLHLFISFNLHKGLTPITISMLVLVVLRQGMDLLFLLCLFLVLWTPSMASHRDMQLYLSLVLFKVFFFLNFISQPFVFRYRYAVSNWFVYKNIVYWLDESKEAPLISLLNRKDILYIGGKNHRKAYSISYLVKNRELQYLRKSLPSIMNSLIYVFSFRLWKCKRIVKGMGCWERKKGKKKTLSR